jgi:hypothetical protein
MRRLFCIFSLDNRSTYGVTLLDLLAYFNFVAAVHAGDEFIPLPTLQVCALCCLN